MGPYPAVLTNCSHLCAWEVLLEVLRGPRGARDQTGAGHVQGECLTPVLSPAHIPAFTISTKRTKFSLELGPGSKSRKQLKWANFRPIKHQRKLQGKSRVEK